MNKNILMVGLYVASLSGLVACTGSGNSSSVTVEGDVPIAYVKRSNNVRINPTDAGNNGSSGDLYIREKSSPSATEYNITGGWTAGLGDVSRPEVSYDGKKIVFAMRCTSGTPCSTWKKPNEPAGEDTTWSIWEYDFSKAKTLDKGDLHRVMDIVDAKKGDDFDPTYLPGGQGFVFTSRRQAKSSSSTAGQPGYVYLDEYEREHVAVLHTMDAKGGNIQQISFNQSHDRSPTILQNGRILYSRWDHVGGRNHFTLFTMKPDGTDMFVLYGAHSAGNSRLHPREMQDGRVITDLMPLSGTQEGGALMVLDVQNYSEQNTPANSSVPKNGGQQSVTATPIDFNSRNISLYGRITTPYPLWDGTDRVLVAFSPCQVTKGNQVVPCASLSPTELSGLTQARLQATIDADPVKDNAPVSYSIQMFDMKTQSFRTVVSAVPGVMVKDPVALLARKEPNNLVSSPASSSLTGTLSVRSVYDTDDLGRMGDPVLSAAELVSNPIPKVPPIDPEDTRSMVANIAALKDPLNPAYLKRPARFVRITKAVATPDGISRETIGETDFEMQEILGYADVEPDGSFKVKVPADTPIAITLTDAEGRAFQAHTNWIQVRPDERRTCDGCHSPRRGAALNSGMLLEDHPNTLMAKLPSTLMSMRVGETMADTRTRLDPSALQLQPQIEFKDVWANTAITGVTQTPCISLRYSGSTTCRSYNTDNTDVLNTPAPVPAADGSITINYPDHIQPLWNLHCVSCHNATAVVSNTTKLDLSDTLAGTGRMTSYQKLLVGDPVLGANNQPVTRIRDGVLVVTLGPALVDNMASQGDAVGLARKSRLMEILSGETLKASDDARALFPTPPNHAMLLNAAEKRLLAEWIDLGGQYYNNPNKIVNGVSIKRSVNTLSRATFDSTIHPILMTTCAGCHQAGGTDPSAPAPTFQNNRFVLTGGSEGDFNVTLSMVSNACAPDSNYLLSKPSTIPHPSTLATTQTAAVLPSTGANYAAIRTWIAAAGCVR